MRYDIIPVWLVFVGAVAMVWLSIEIGFRIGSTVFRRVKDEEKESPVGVIAGAILGLLAFVLAFAFGIVADRFESRKQLVRDEASAIRTAWRRTDFLSPADRNASAALLIDYLRLRVDLATAAKLDLRQAGVVVARSRDIQQALWAMARSNARLDMNSDIGAMYVDALNDLESISHQRIAVAMQARLPWVVWAVLYATLMLAMAGVGYQTGIAGSRRSMSRAILAGSFAMILTMVAILDNPESTWIRVSQQPEVDLLAEMSAAEGMPAATQ